MRYFFLLLLFLVCLSQGNAQTAPANQRWQQRAEYKMDIDFDVQKHRYEGKQTLTYFNNSPDTITRVFYHLYFNAFQPGSGMDVRNKDLPDSDPRVGSRIGKLKDDEIGFIKVKSLQQDRSKLDYETNETILEVKLQRPLPPGGKTVLTMEWDAQVPLQIRRSGRMNSEGIDYSMSQWYPKLCEYDEQGWHANPYIGREFYGVWGDFEVNITIDPAWKMAAGAILQNSNEIGFGYDQPDSPIKPTSGKRTWKWKVENVHDFMWAADPEYVHLQRKAKDGTLMHFFYVPGNKTTENWTALPEVMDEAFSYIAKTYGPYPYGQYYFIQGGDGGMEYPLGTLITGHRSFNSLVGVSVHELMHSWYQMMMGTNEALYAWMDEGFTSYASDDVMNYLAGKNLLRNVQVKKDPHVDDITGYLGFRESGKDEALSVHADHFQTNTGYSVAAYVKGSLFLLQTQYIIGKQAFNKGMLDYYRTWRFKHPTPNDFIRIMEHASELELDWFKEYFVNTTHLPDYKVEEVKKDGRKNATVVMRRVGLMPMPLDVQVTLSDGSKHLFTIPLDLMRGAKNPESSAEVLKVAKDWPWVNRTYELEVPFKLDEITEVEIDPSQRMIDTNRDDNRWQKKS